MIKSFAELSKIEVKPTKKPVFKWNKAKQDYDKVGELDVVSWVDCLKVLYENGAEKVVFENIQNENGGLLFLDENKSISIKVFVEIDGDRREIFYPVINGSSDIKADKVSQSDIYNAKQRAFVKCVAVNWGLGISFWERDNPDEVEGAPKESVEDLFRGIVNESIKVCGGVNEMLSHLENVKRKDIEDLLLKTKTIDGIIKTLTKVLDEKKENDKKSKSK